MIENDLVQVLLIGIFVMVNSDKRDFESAVVHLFFQLEHVVAAKTKTKIIIYGVAQHKSDPGSSTLGKGDHFIFAFEKFGHISQVITGIKHDRILGKEAKGGKRI
jgi:hypothetical protein